MKPITEKQKAMLERLAKIQAGGCIRPHSSQNAVARGLEIRGLITRTDYNDCVITESGRKFLRDA